MSNQYIEKLKNFPKENPNWCWAIIIVMFLFIIYSAGYLPIVMSSLDNRPRWMMGGLRDDTGSHNAKDVFGMGFGLDQTRTGTQTVDNKYMLGRGTTSLALGDKVQSEYGGFLGQ